MDKIVSVGRRTLFVPVRNEEAFKKETGKVDAMTTYSPVSLAYPSYKISKERMSKVLTIASKQPDFDDAFVRLIRRLNKKMYDEEGLYLFRARSSSGGPHRAIKEKRSVIGLLPSLVATKENDFYFYNSPWDDAFDSHFDTYYYNENDHVDIEIEDYYKQKFRKKHGRRKYRP
jgi:hypothetical protein